MSGRTVSVLGATGSVGRATLDLIARAEPGRFDVVALTANANAEALAEAAKRLGAKFCAVADEAAGPALKDALAGTNIACGAGEGAILDAAAMDADWTMAAIVGAAGLKPTLEAVRRGRCVAFANKEALVCAGELFMAEARRSGATLLPVDSEHNAVFQAFNEAQREGIRRIIQFEPDLGFCLRPDFVRGVNMLAEFDLSFDICIDYRHTKVATQFVDRCPNVRMTLDHIGKPDIAGGGLDPWRSEIAELAKRENVWCKTSSLATEAVSTPKKCSDS